MFHFISKLFSSIFNLIQTFKQILPNFCLSHCTFPHKIMGWKLWKTKSIFTNFQITDYLFFVQPIYVISIILHSLLLPLSFLLLARLSSVYFLLSLDSLYPPKSSIFSVFLSTNPNLIHLLVSVISLAALTHALTSRISPISEQPGPIFRPRLWAAWIFLCILEACVGLGIESTINAGVDGEGFSDGRSMLSKMVFFLGLHETMVYWSRTIVRPVVDNTIFGGAQKERLAERWALAACFGAVSWWRLRDEVESLVVVVEVKKGMMMKVGLGDFIGLWLYYLTVAIGMARIIKAILWISISIFRRVTVTDDQDSNVEFIGEEQDKV